MRVDLGNGMWMELKEDMTYNDQQRIYRSMKVYDPINKAYYDDEMQASQDPR